MTVGGPRAAPRHRRQALAVGDPAAPAAPDVDEIRPRQLTGHPALLRVLAPDVVHRDAVATGLRTATPLERDEDRPSSARQQRVFGLLWRGRGQHLRSGGPPDRHLTTRLVAAQSDSTPTTRPASSGTRWRTRSRTGAARRSGVRGIPVHVLEHTGMTRSRRRPEAPVAC